MGTIMHFGNRKVVDNFSGKEVDLELGTSGAMGNGPQLYLNLNGQSICLSHEDAKVFCEAVDGVAKYLGY